MENKIIELISQDNWDDAANLLLEVMDKKTFTDTLAVLGATINEHYNDKETTFEFIQKGLYINPSNYELYVLLGNYYLPDNANLTYLCYENALFYCEKEGNTEDGAFIEEMIHHLCTSYDVSVNPCSIIMKVDSKEDLTDCLAGIKENCKKDSYEIVAYTKEKNIESPEENIKYLTYEGKQEEIYNFLIENANTENDILLLDANSYMMQNTLYTLRMGLYADANIGSAGAMSNCAMINQIIQSDCNSFTDFVKLAQKTNIPQQHAIEYQMCIDSYAILIKRNALNKIGLFDTALIGNQYMENDLGLRLITSGYKNAICHNSFLFRFVDRCVKQMEKENLSEEIQQQNMNYLKSKWSEHNNPLYYNSVRHELVQYITEPKDSPINVLEVGCGTGASLNNIKYLYPNATVKGIEIVEEIAKLGAMNLDIISGDIETMNLPYEKNFFDYIIFGDVLEHLRYPEDVLINMKNYLKKGGHIITSIPNIMNARVIYNLLRGYFTYEKEGILDRTHLRFFTYHEIVNVFERTDYKIEQVIMNQVDKNSTDNFREFFDQLLTIEGVADRNQFDTFQYHVVATKE